MILNVYKEKNWTSFDVVAKVRNMLGGKRKVGHAGTLDPLAEGVLIVLTDEDTKKQDEFMKMKKEYVAKITFGITTPTYDLEFLPEVSKRQIGLENLKTLCPVVLKDFEGEIDQKVPPYSAAKVDGKTLYKEARKGKVDEVSLPVKRITIYKIEILETYDEDVETKDGKRKFPSMKARVECSSGTYIRSLAHDLGEKFGCGAVMMGLVRTRIGEYSVSDSKKITELSFKPGD
jgi:tRNA pseudouridine55 synthase